MVMEVIMDLRRMRIFQEVAHLGSFTKAAQRLYMSQPAVSKAIRELEEEIQTPLFERFPKKVILTPEGERFLKSVKSLFLQYDSLQEEISQLSAHAHLRIGSSITIANSSLCELLAQLQAEFNAMDVSIEVASSAAILTKLKENQLDIAYVEGMIPEEDFTHIPVAAYAIYAVTAPSFLAQHPLTCMQDFAALPLLLRGRRQCHTRGGGQSVCIGRCVYHPGLDINQFHGAVKGGSTRVWHRLFTGSDDSKKGCPKPVVHHRTAPASPSQPQSYRLPQA